MDVVERIGWRAAIGTTVIPRSEDILSEMLSSVFSINKIFFI
tara:strand:- start:430 stop:555 length:126 start_codon:yes stop_codon:yes gene_type:complete